MSEHSTSNCTSKSYNFRFEILIADMVGAEEGEAFVKVRDLLSAERLRSGFSSWTRDTYDLISFDEYLEAERTFESNNEYDEDRYLNAMKWLSWKIKGAYFFWRKGWYDRETEEYLCGYTVSIVNGKVYNHLFDEFNKEHSELESYTFGSSEVHSALRLYMSRFIESHQRD